MGITLKRTSADKRIRRGYALAFFLLLFGYFATFYANRELLHQSGKVEHTNKMIANLEVMLSKLKDAETGMRGYIITKDQDFLSPYIGSVASIDSLYQLINELTANNPEQQERLMNLKPFIDKRVTVFPEIIKHFNKSNREIDDSLKELMYNGKEMMDSIRLKVAIIQVEENISLAKRNTKLKETFSSVKLITFISVTLAFILIVFAFVTYREENKARKKGVKEIDDYQQQLKNRIDELHTANIELVRMRSQEKFAATGRIARTIAHEVRNPLTNINLAMEQLKTEQVVKQDEASEMLFGMIKRNSTRINQLISDLLNSTKFSELTYEKISVNDLMDETLKEAQDRIALTNVTVVKKYNPGVCDIDVDKAKIKIALLNIIINALEAMENKEGSVLTIETKGENDKCKVIISDNGSGLDADAATRLFEPYFTSKPNGNGLGLTNTQNIILNHKGEISVETKKGNGASFTILLNFSS